MSVVPVKVVEHVHVIELRLVIPGLSGLSNYQQPRFKVFQENPDLPELNDSIANERPELVDEVVESSLAPVAEAIEDQRTLVELYQDLLSERDKERRVSVKTIRDNKSVLNRFQQWAEKSDCFAAIKPPIRLLEEKGILRGFAEYIRNQPKGHSAAMANKATRRAESRKHWSLYESELSELLVSADRIVGASSANRDCPERQSLAFARR